jgi:hypothetical protein
MRSLSYSSRSMRHYKYASIDYIELLVINTKRIGHVVAHLSISNAQWYPRLQRLVYTLKPIFTVRQNHQLQHSLYACTIAARLRFDVFIYCVPVARYAPLLYQSARQCGVHKTYKRKLVCIGNMPTFCVILKRQWS